MNFFADVDYNVMHWMFVFADSDPTNGCFAASEWRRLVACAQALEMNFIFVGDDQRKSIAW